MIYHKSFILSFKSFPSSNHSKANPQTASAKDPHMQWVGDGAVLVHVVGHHVDDRRPRLRVLGHAPPVERLAKLGVVVVDVLDLYGERGRGSLLLSGRRLVLAHQSQSNHLDLLSVQLPNRPDHALHLADFEGVGVVVLRGLRGSGTVSMRSAVSGGRGGASPVWTLFIRISN